MAIKKEDFLILEGSISNRVPEYFAFPPVKKNYTFSVA
jgi:hypothetical protein